MTTMTDPRDVLERFAAAWAARDAQAIADLFVADPEFVNVTGMWWHTPERIRIAHAFGFERIFANSDLTFIESRSRYIGDSAATVHGKWQVLDQSTGEGQTADPRQGIFLFVMEKTPEGWKVVAAHNTDIVSGHESNAVVNGHTIAQSYADSPTSRGL